MVRRTFSITQVALVAMLLLAIFLISKTVTPPPPRPPKVADASNTINKAAPSGKSIPVKPPLVPVTPAVVKSLKKMHLSDKAIAGLKKNGIPVEMMSRLSEAANQSAQHKKPAPDPYSIQVTNAYWSKNKMGKIGEEQQRSVFKKEVAELKAMQLTAKAANQSKTPVPPPAP